MKRRRSQDKPPPQAEHVGSTKKSKVEEEEDKGREKGEVQHEQNSKRCNNNIKKGTLQIGHSAPAFEAEAVAYGSFASFNLSQFAGLYP